MAIERYLGGGKVFLSLWNGTAYETEVEVGEIQSATLKISHSYADAFSKDTGIKKKVEKVPTNTEATLSFTTQNVDKRNLALAMYGADTETETFLLGSTLPDGTVATVDITIPVINGATLTKIEAKVRIVGANATGTFNPVLVVFRVALTPSGDIRDYFTDSHATLGFDGEILEVSEGYFKEYQMAKA